MEMCRENMTLVCTAIKKIIRTKFPELPFNRVFRQNKPEEGDGDHHYKLPYKSSANTCFSKN